MPISFNSIPANWKLPLVSMEVDPSQAGTVVLDLPALLVGQKLAGGSATSSLPIPVATQAQANAAFGQGSMLARMMAAFFARNAAAKVYCLPLDEPSGGTKSVGTFTVSAGATAAGIVALYIAGQRVQTAVGASDAKETIAANMVAAINAVLDQPVVAAARSSPNTHVVDVTAKWKGLTGNDIRLDLNYAGQLAGEVLPAGVAITLVQPADGTAGTGAPSMTAAITAIQDDNYEYVAMPFLDATSLTAWENEFGFGDNGRWGWLREEYGGVYSARRGVQASSDLGYADLITYGGTRNSPVVSSLAIEQAAPTPVWEWAASYCANAARALLNDPARPLQTLELTGCLPAVRGSRFSKTSRNNLASTGLATQTLNGDGNPMIEIEATSYRVNTYGQADDAYFVATTLATLSYILRFLRTRITNKYPRHKLANNGTRFGSGQAIVTPNVIRAELVAAYRELEFLGIAENADAFKNALIVERDSSNPNRVNILYPPDLVNQLRVVAVLAQFRLQFSTTPA